MFIVDGQWYIREGDMPTLLDKMISEEKFVPVITVFIDNRDPDYLNINRRNSQFLCNEKYVHFVVNELVSFIDANYKTKKSADARVMMGLSFGGLNAAHFALKAPDVFHLIAMQSPALHPCPTIYTGFQKIEKLPLKIYMSTGANNDTEDGTRKLKKILDEKGYSIKYQEVNEGHNWKNWKPLLDDILTYFFAK
jgi:enterochelin esterase-like enzyme